MATCLDECQSDLISSETIEPQFDISIADSAGIIDRTTTDTVGTDIHLNQTGGTPQGISLFLLHNLPTGATATLSNYSVFSSGTSRLTVEADVFATPGIYPVAIQAICGDRIKIQSFEVTIRLPTWPRTTSLSAFGKASTIRFRP